MPRGGRPFPGRSRAGGPPAIGAEHDDRMVTDERALAELIERLAAEPVYALDTEFHRERTYYPKLALVQLAWPRREEADGGAGGIEVALLDPLAVDVRPLGELLVGPAMVVIHAAAQDLEVLEVATGAVPACLFDTQIAAGFLGLGLPSLSELHERELGTSIPKGDRLTDWLRRPLSTQQLAYAASDVADLPRLHERLTVELGVERVDGLRRQALDQVGEAPLVGDQTVVVLGADRGWPLGAGSPREGTTTSGQVDLPALANGKAPLDPGQRPSRHVRHPMAEAGQVLRGALAAGAGPADEQRVLVRRDLAAALGHVAQRDQERTLGVDLVELVGLPHVDQHRPLAHPLGGRLHVKLRYQVGLGRFVLILGLTVHGGRAYLLTIDRPATAERGVLAAPTGRRRPARPACRRRGGGRRRRPPRGGPRARCR